jgi:hypothetical protein
MSVTAVRPSISSLTNMVAASTPKMMAVSITTSKPISLSIV